MVGRKINVVPLPHWPTPARWERLDVPWLHSDTFIVIKEQQKQ